MKGFGLVEIVLGSAIVTLAMFGILSVAEHSLRVSRQALDELKAAYLLEEGAEALRSMRDRGFTTAIASLPTSTPQFLMWMGGGSPWFATSSANVFTDGIFERSFEVFDVRRDGSDRIAASGTLDAGTRKIRIGVSWQGQNGTTTKTLELYLTNI